jgi:uncharacterized protein (TIGR01777 family)
VKIMGRRRLAVIAGGSGFIGSALSFAPRSLGDHVTLISRTPGPDRMTWSDLARRGLPACDAVVNLAGQHILDLRRRWTAAYRDEVVNSRVKTTKQVVKALNQSGRRPLKSSFRLPASASTARAHSKRWKPTPNWTKTRIRWGSISPVQLWEAFADDVDGTHLRHVKLRLGIVLAGMDRLSRLARLWPLGRSRGILPIIVVPFRLGLGAVIGSGRQPVPWIHIDDMVGIPLHIIDRPETRGRYNAVAPGIVTNREFVEALARHLRSGYLFRYPRLEPALADLVSVRNWTAGRRSCCART